MGKTYTKNGDDGYSNIGGRRMQKNEKIFDALGTIDELSSFIALAKIYCEEKENLKEIQTNLFEIGGIIGAVEENEKPSYEKFEKETEKLEQEIDKLDEKLPTLKRFIYPGGSIQAAHLHVCRTVCRRAERAVVKLQNPNLGPIIKYLNRLSSYFFALARWENFRQKIPEEEW
ncbi:MAG: cob(I)yrinic acid a,c-diamide adenosyltransferase [Candidatus Micrarchaeota archaeon]|nr:cob(I)yrinic acid a,c-diamide adenosyltransferase [Candidatus Micrarchaeota archaeon]